MHSTEKQLFLKLILRFISITILTLSIIITLF